MSKNGGNIDEILRSVPSQRVSYVKFCNKTLCDVSLEWIDFKGDHTKCARVLTPEMNLEIKTFVGHPWVAYDAKYRHEMSFTAARNRIFFPTPTNRDNGGHTQIFVPIFTPEKSLQRICAEKVHQCIQHHRKESNKVIKELPIHFLLQEKLRKLILKQMDHNIPVRMVEMEN